MRPRMRGTVRHVGLIGVLALSCTCGPKRTPDSAAPTRTVQQAASAEPLTPDDARHLLNRAAFGPAPGEVEHVVALGLDGWLDEQLDPRAVDPPARSIEPYAEVLAPQSALIRRFQKGAEMGSDLDDGDGKNRLRLNERELLSMLEMVKVSRHISSERRLLEVMVDFWANHFNVHGTKAQLALSAPDYLEGIRARALGRFADLLAFTAQHPAMLVYLDNAMSIALPERRNGTSRDPFRGLNENYARELLELHTLGVDGGYSQEDVRELARVLTGWGIAPRADGGMEFAFHPRRHDGGSKVVLGQHIAPSGQDEGEAVLLALARHPATARHLATKLCRRFVADDPPAQCVAEVSAAYRASDGDMGVSLRALLQSQTFWSSAVRGQKFKSPLEFVVSAARATGARPDGTLKLARRIAEMGEGLFQYPAPTGYPEVAAAWLSSGALLARFELATELARGKAAGLQVVPASPDDADDETILAAAEQRVLGGPASDATRQAILLGLQELKASRQRRLAALSLLIGSPEFQRQ